MKLYLAEHRHQVADLLEKGQQGMVTWVALGPGAMHALRNRGIPFVIPEDLVTREEVEEACLAQFERLSQTCRQLDTRLGEREPFLREWGIRPFFFHLWQLAKLADILLCGALILNKTLERLKPQEIHIHVTSPEDCGLIEMGSLCVPVWGLLLELPGWPARIVHWPEPPPATENKVQGGMQKSISWRGLSPWISAWVRRHPLAYSLGKSWRHGWWANFVNLIRPDLDFEVVLCNDAYEWQAVIPKLIANGHPVRFLSSEDLIANGYRRCPAGETATAPEWQVFKEGLTLEPMDFSGLLEDRFRFIREEAPRLALSMLARLEKILPAPRVRALLVSTGMDYAFYVIKQYCRRQGIKVMSWQHGAEWYNARMVTQRNDLLNLVGCDRMLVFGEGVRAGYAASPLAQEEGCRIDCVGMPSLKQLRALAPQRPRDRSRLLWPFGGYYQNKWYCGFSPPHSDRVYYQEQMVILEELLEQLEALPGLTLTVKLYPSPNLTWDPPWVEDLVHRDRVRIVKSKPTFVELLGEHDVLLIDSPTTTLLQAVATRLPVFALMSVVRWPEEALRLLRRRAWVAESAAELMMGLSKYLQGEQMADVNHDEFLKQYGLGREDGEWLAQSLIEMK